jgi:hypothetical protein
MVRGEDQSSEYFWVTGSKSILSNRFFTWRQFHPNVCIRGTANYQTVPCLGQFSEFNKYWSNLFRMCTSWWGIDKTIYSVERSPGSHFWHYGPLHKEYDFGFQGKLENNSSGTRSGVIKVNGSSLVSLSGVTQ